MNPKFTPSRICLAPNVRPCSSVGCSALGRNGLETRRSPGFFPGFISVIAALLRLSLLYLTREKVEKRHAKTKPGNTI